MCKPKYAYTALPAAALAAIVLGGLAAVLVSCGTPEGQLFCRLQMGDGGAFVVGLINAEASTVAGAGPAAIIATDAGKQYVDQKCTDAARVAGAVSGAPVSPPTVAVPAVAVSAAAVPAAK